MTDKQLQNIAAALARRLTTRAEVLLEGTAADIEWWAEALVADAMAAAAIGRGDLLECLEEQAVARVEARRLELAGATWDQVAYLVGDVLAAVGGLVREVKP